MQLKKIKLAGFKSFVDPTTIILPSNLVGVVGPNGCGKSNIIDAVRWVLGESRAKQLRGVSMDDVIFNGSSARKPVGKAMVDLVFDNSEGRIGGQYAQYKEISIRRELTREGGSSYFLNGTRCRRRDIQDVFLGTGLGPGSYAIIEQGMISRLVEAKPEELRGYLEEAAGISKYKERRRETQNRINRTNENISRIKDIYTEIEKRIKVLERQASQAEKYKELKQEERELRALILGQQWKTLGDNAQGHQQTLQQGGIDLEKLRADLTHIEAEIESCKVQRQTASETFNEVQGKFYSTGAEVSRYEASIEHAKQQQKRQKQDLERTQQGYLDLKEHLETDETRLQRLQSQLAEDEPQKERLDQAVKHSSTVLVEQEQAMHVWEKEWEEFNTQANQRSRSSEVQKIELQHAQQQIERRRERLQKITEELATLTPQNEDAYLADLKQNHADIDRDVAAAQAELTGLNAALQSKQSERQEAVIALKNVEQAQQQYLHQLARLEAQQEAALTQDHENEGWLRDLDLHEAKRLAQSMQVDKGWEKAVETVLQHFLNAVGCDDMSRAMQASEQFDSGSVVLINAQTKPSDASSDAPSDASHLLSKVRCDWPIAALLHGVHWAEDVTEAQSRLPTLQTYESIVTRDGVWLGQDWLRVQRPSDKNGQDSGGILEREQSLKQLQKEAKQGAAEVEQRRSDLDRLEKSLQELTEQRENQQQLLTQKNEARMQLAAELTQLQAKLEHQNKRRMELEDESSSLKETVFESEKECLSKQTRLDEASGDVEKDHGARESMTSRRSTIKDALDAARNQARMDQQSLHEVSIRIETARVQHQSAQDNLVRLRKQLAELSAHREQLSLSLEQIDTPIHELESQLSAALQSKIDAENKLTQCRSELESVDYSLREMEQNRVEKEREIQGKQSSLEQLRLAMQETEIRRKTLVEQIIEIGFQLETLAEKLTATASMEAMNEILERLRRRIERMEPVNLAAVDEFKQESERKDYLEAQINDLKQALDTLEAAMHKIDKETRSRFKDTFEKANTSLQKFYPKLMGGGRAELKLTEQDLLNTGVTVIAQPPGKRNASIHLLSGGEKALTAIALVFSLFELNPAPFCVLDEVDAPLDDYNVGRYADMIKSMSEQVQFIFITHNKITMEVAKQLVGVTMHEAGVSRPVDVDIDRAVELAAA